MARWFSDLFGRPGSDSPDHDPASRPPDGPPDRIPMHPGDGANDKTLRIGSSKSSAKLSWPARDGQDAPAQPRAEDRYARHSRDDDAHDAATPMRLDPAGRPRPESRCRAGRRRRRIVRPPPDNERVRRRDGLWWDRLGGRPCGLWSSPVTRGRSLEIGASISIGRANDSVGFGDMQIFAKTRFIYDPRSHRFFLHPAFYSTANRAAPVGHSMAVKRSRWRYQLLRLDQISTGRRDGHHPGCWSSR